MSPELVFLVILASSSLGFGGFGSIPVLRHLLAGAGLNADALILQALTVGRLSPGPNGLFLTAVGYLVAGVAGAVAATAALFLPPLLILPLVALRSRLEHRRRFRAVIRSLSLAVVALLIATSVAIVGQVASSVHTALLVGLGGVLLIRRVPPLLILVAAAGVGWVAMS